MYFSFLSCGGESTGPGVDKASTFGFREPGRRNWFERVWTARCLGSIREIWVFMSYEITATHQSFFRVFANELRMQFKARQ